jgi:glycosyltransferase involved in cell wall biosynthesis
MDTEFVLGYSGTLNHFGGKTSSSLLNYIWTYKRRHSDDSTRSAYYLFHAVKKLSDEGKISPGKFRMLFWGLIDPRTAVLASQLGVDSYLEIKGYLPKKQSLEMLRSCSALFLPLESSSRGEPLFVPGKMFEYLSTGLPVFALAEKESDAGKIMKGAGNALISDPRNVDRIAGDLLKLISGEVRLPDKPDSSFIDRFSWHNTAREMAAVFSGLLKRNVK